MDKLLHSIRQTQKIPTYYLSETLSILPETVAFNTSTQICRTSRMQKEMKYTDTRHEVYAMSFSMVVIFSQIMLKTFTRAVDSVISYIAKVINTNYNSNKCCCMNNKQLIQLYTPNYRKVFINLDAIGQWFPGGRGHSPGGARVGYRMGGKKN